MEYFGREDKFKVNDLKKMKQEMKLDSKYGIKTSGVEELDNNPKYFHYVPTPYDVLNKLFSKYPFKESDVFVDVGCGLGRVLVITAKLGCKKVVGIEVNQSIYERLCLNVKESGLEDSIDVYCGKAEEWIGSKVIANKFFFFNPFEVSVLNEIIDKIIEMKLDDTQLYFWAPYESYIEYLHQKSNITIIEVMKCEGYDEDEFSIYICNAN